MQKYTCLLICFVESMVGLGILLVTPSSAQNKPPAPDAVHTIAVADNRFGFRLLETVSSQEANANICVSPFSVALALQMSYNGANGSTKTAMARTLQLDNLSLAEVNTSSKALLDSLHKANTIIAPTRPAANKPVPASLPAPMLAIANSLWFANLRGIKPAFTQSAQTYYQAQVNSLQGAPQTINTWVSRHTNAKITQIVTAADLKEAVAVLVNAIYFKGTWKTPFNKALTDTRAFHPGNGSTQNCRMMLQTGKFLYYASDAFQMVSLPYSGEQLEMLLILPRVGEKTDTLLPQLTSEHWQQWTDGMKMKQGEIGLPRFRAEYSVTLNKALSALGMAQAFQPSADFSNMTPGAARISKVLHKTFVEVNEEGTEAAAATAVVHSKSAMRAPAEPPFQMILDRPFMYALRDRQTGALLFLGTLTKPASE